MNVRIISNNDYNENKSLVSLKKRLMSRVKQIVFISNDFDDNVIIEKEYDLYLVIPSNYDELYRYVSYIKNKSKLIIISPIIDPDFIVECIKFSSCVCYLKGNLDTMINKILKKL